MSYPISCAICGTNCKAKTKLGYQMHWKRKHPTEWKAACQKHKDRFQRFIGGYETLVCETGISLPYDSGPLWEKENAVEVGAWLQWTYKQWHNTPELPIEEGS